MSHICSSYKVLLHVNAYTLHVHAGNLPGLQIPVGDGKGC